MKQKTRILIYILIGAAIVIAGTIIMFAKAAADKKPDVGRHIDLGQKYLIELSYDKAVLEFTEAIEIEPQNPDAYKGLALTYEAMGDTKQALAWLRKGYDLTGDSSLKAEMDRINAYLQPAETTVTTAVTTTVTTTEATTTVTTEKMFTVPDLIGLSESDAVSACEMAEIPYAILTEESDSVEKGFVVSQRIPASAKIKEGVELVFVVSEGKKVVTTAALKVITNDELVEVVKQLIKDPNADIEQEKLDMITQIGIIGDEYYAVNESVYYRYDISVITSYFSKPKITFVNNSEKEVKNNNISDLNFIARLKNIEKVDLLACNIKDISALNKTKKLTHLSLAYNNISDIGALSDLTDLTKLELNNNNISEISALSRLSNLTSLYVDNNKVNDITPLKNLNKLNVLQLSDNKISDITALSKLTNLTYLHIGNNQISDISALSELTNLYYLFAHYNNISDISALSKLTNLLYLDVIHNNISDISALSKLTNLSYLYAANNKISDISALRKLTNLTYLNLEENKISDVSALSNLTKLTELYLGLNEISQEDIDELREKLPNCMIQY